MNKIHSSSSKATSSVRKSSVRKSSVRKSSVRKNSVRKNSVRRIATNAASILASNVTNRVATFITYALVARYLGAFEFGQMSLGLVFFRTFQLLAVAGLQTLVTREVAKDKTKTDQYLVNGSIIVGVSSLLSILALVLFTWIMNYSPGTTSVILLLSLGLVPFSLSIMCDAVFQAREQMHYSAYVNGVVSISRVALAYLILARGLTLYHIVALFFFSHVATLVAKWWLLLRYVVRPRLGVDWRFCLTMAKATVVFLGINGLNAVMTSLNTILLSKFAGEAEVGFYNAATQLMIPVSLAFESVIVSVYPVMCKSFDPSLQKLKRISEYVLEFLLSFVLPAAAGLFLLADSILLLLYGNGDFSQAAVALRIIVWGLALRVCAKVFGLVLVASMREKVTLRILAIDVLTLITLGPILVSQFGLVGSAMTSLVVRLVDFVQHYRPVSDMFARAAMGRLAWKPIAASVIMVAYLVLVREQAPLLTIASAGLLYGVVLSALTVWSVGGIRQLKARYVELGSV